MIFISTLLDCNHSLEWEKTTKESLESLEVGNRDHTRFTRKHQQFNFLSFILNKRVRSIKEWTL